MKSEELNIIALEAAKSEFEKSMAMLKNAALQGKMSVRINNLSEGAITLLNKNGFQIVGPRKSLLHKRVYTVGFHKHRC